MIRFVSRAADAGQQEGKAFEGKPAVRVCQRVSQEITDGNQTFPFEDSAGAR